jgi:predicted dehydrogenase
MASLFPTLDQTESTTARRINRRGLLKSAIGSAGVLILPSARTAFGYQANDRIQLAVIGHMYNAGHFFSSAHIYENAHVVALCDAEEQKIAETFAAWRMRAMQGSDADDPQERRAAGYYGQLVEKMPRAFSDPRRMLAEMGDEIDAIVVSTFDHTHGAICGPAIRAGKHVFNERPVGLTINDARSLRALAVKHKVATSIRNPGNASQQFRRVVELIREGAIGPVEEVHVWFPRGGPDHTQPPQGSRPIPEGLNWDAWLGPAAWRPYHPQWMAYAQWREFSNGGIGTFGPHAANLAFMALRVGDLWEDDSGAVGKPIRVEAKCNRINRLSFPRWEIVRWQIPARGDLPAVTFTWHHGPDPDLAPGSRELIAGMLRERGASDERVESLFKEAGTLIVGTKGAIASDSHNTSFFMLPEEKFRDVEQKEPKTLKSSRGHYRDWLIACRGGEPAWSSFDYAGPFSEFLMLGNMATQFEAELEYDPVAGKILNNAEANKTLSYEYREGWTL